MSRSPFQSIRGNILGIKKTSIIRAFGKVLFLLYVGFLIYFLFVAEWYGRTAATEEYRYNLELFKEIRRFITYREQLGNFTVFANLFGNILIFVPYGFFISMASRSRGFFKTLFCSMGLSLCVEIVQLFTRVGSFDVDDILLNIIGGVLGYVLFDKEKTSCSESEKALNSVSGKRNEKREERGNTARLILSILVWELYPV